MDATRDLRFAAIQHVRRPGPAVVIVTTLALGIGANVTMVGAIDRLLFRAPAHVRNTDRVVRLLLVAPDPLGGQHVSARTSYPAFRDLEREVPSLEAIGAFWSTRLSLGTGKDAVETSVSFVTPSFFSVLGVGAAIGRVFMPTDEAELQGTPIAVLGHGFWNRQFASDSSILGRTIHIGSGAYSVVGVAPEGFRGPESKAVDAWLPLTAEAVQQSHPPLSLEERGSAWLSMIALLRRDATRSRVEEQATNVWREYNSAAGGNVSQRRIMAASIIAGRGPDRPRGVNVALWLGGVSVLVLLIACANVTNLLLARAFVRRREIAVRLALGAGRSRLARQMLVEALFLAGLGGTIALSIAVLGGSMVQRLLLTEDLAGPFLDARLFIIAASIALGTGVLISLVPLIQTTAPDLTQALREGAATTGGRVSRVRAALLAVQSALCMMLLIGAGLFAQSLHRVEGLDLGLDLDHTLMVKVDFRNGMLSRPEIEASYAALRERVESVNGVVRTVLAEHDPYSFGRAVAAHTRERSPVSLWHQGVREVPMQAAVDSGFFRTVGANSLRGRDFGTQDRRGSPPVAIINEPLAELLWPGEDPLNQCMLVSWEGGDCVTVVGVLRGFWRGNILEREKLVVYVPLAQSEYYIAPGRMLVAIEGDPEPIIRAVRGAVQGVRADMPAVSVTRMRDLVDPQLKPWRLAASMFVVFGGVALLVAVVGLYGVVAFAAAQRSAETAIRIALGAQPRHVLSVIAGEALTAVIAGLAIGALLALALRRWIGPLLFQTSPSDPGILIGTGLLLLSVALLASLIPTMQALRRNPAAMLRVD